MEVRLVVDPLAARTRRRKGQGRGHGADRESLERQRRAQEDARPRGLFKENLYFHWAIAAASHNPVVRMLSESLHNITLEGGLKIKFRRSERLPSIEDHSRL